MPCRSRRALLSVLLISVALRLRAADEDRGEKDRMGSWREARQEAQDVFVKAQGILAQAKQNSDPERERAGLDMITSYLETSGFPSARVFAMKRVASVVAESEKGVVPPSPQAAAALAISAHVKDVVHQLYHKKLEAQGRDPADVDKTIDAAGLGLHDGDYRGSLRLARAALLRRPESPRVHYTMARDLFELGDYKESSRSASEAIKRDPKNAGAWSTRAAASFKLGDWNLAYADARQATALDPDDHMAQTILAVARKRMEMSAPEPDSQPLSPALSPNPSPASRRGEGIGRGEKPRQDLRHLETTLDAAAGTPANYRAQSFYKDALNKFELGDYQGAAESAGVSLRLSPASPEPYAARASAYNYLGRYPEAVADATRSLDLERNNPVALNARSWALNQSGRPREGLADAREAVRLAPRDAFAYLNKALAEEALGLWDETEQDYQTAVALDPSLAPTVAAAAPRFEKAAGRPLRLRPSGSGDARPGPRWTFSAVALVGGLGGGFLLAFLLATRKEEATLSPAPSPESGRGEDALIGGCYRIIREIGRGGMGVVYEAEDLALDRKVALKRMKEEVRLRPRDKDRFLQEARTVAALRHPNIVAIHSIFEEGEDLYLVFEHVEGMTLDEHLYRRRRLAPAEARPILKAVCDALGYAHGQRVIHRDLKPSNIMLGDDGAVKVMDFGIARQAKDAAAAATGTEAVGTPAYMAPEMERGQARRESDLYMLGAVLYEMLTGQMPFAQGSDFHRQKLAAAFAPPSLLVPELPPELDGVLRKALAADPEQRYRAPQELMAAFDAAVAARMKAEG